MDDSCIWLTVFINSLKPCNAKNSHCTGISTPVAETRELTVKIFNEGGHDSDFRVESANQTHQLHVDASADLVKTVNLQDERTHIGYTSGHGLEGANLTAQNWADFPVGFRGMMRSGQGATYGSPTTNYGYFLKFAECFDATDILLASDFDNDR